MKELPRRSSHEVLEADGRSLRREGMFMIPITTPTQRIVPWSISERENGKMCSQKSQQIFQESVLTPQLNSLELSTQSNHQQAFDLRKSRIFSFSTPTNEKKASDSSQFKRWKSIRHSDQQRQHPEKKKGWYISIFVSCKNHSPTMTVHRLKKSERSLVLY